MDHHSCFKNRKPSQCHLPHALCTRAAKLLLMITELPFLQEHTVGMKMKICPEQTLFYALRKSVVDAIRQ